jgi:hypothetical protein
MITSVGDSLGWPFKDPSWLSKIVLQGLILIIPIIGQIALYGWLLITMDNLRAGRNELAPAGFHLGRGIGLFGVYLIYGIVIAIPAVVLGVAGGAMVAQNSGGGGSALIALGYLYEIVAGLFLLFLAPSIISTVWERGFSGGMDVASVWQRAIANPTNSIVAGLIILAAGVIAGFGFILCFVGILFTTVWSYGVQAAAAFWFASQSRGTAQAPSAAGPTAQ